MSGNKSGSSDDSKRNWKENNYNSEKKYENMIQKLAWAEKERKLVVFIGAGVSIAQGYPNWDGYVDHFIKYWQFNIQSMVESKKIPRETILLFDKIAQGNYSNKRKIDFVHQILKKILGEKFEKNKLNFEKFYFNEVIPFKPENTILASLSDLDATFITPNYDQEIEKHLKRKRKSVPVINDLGEFADSYFRLKNNHVLHIHGTAEGNPQLLINSSAAYSRQYLRYRENFEKLIDWFKQEKPVVLFIGVSLEEDELLSLLFNENENFALMKTEKNIYDNVDNHLRVHIEEFFYEENYTKIFWYGDSFSDLPIVVKDIVTDIKDINKIPILHKYWNTLTKLDTEDTEYVKILNEMANKKEYHSELNQFFMHVRDSHDTELIDKAVKNSFNSAIVIENCTYVPENFWALLDQKYEECDPEQKVLTRNLYLQESFDPRNIEAFNIFKRMSLSVPERNEMITSIAKISNIQITKFSEEPEIMAEWLINQFENGNNSIAIKQEEKVLFKFSENRMDRLMEVLSTQKYNEHIFYPISELIKNGVIQVFYTALKDGRIIYQNKPILDVFPEKLLEVKLIQKLLIILSSLTTVSPDLIIKLIDRINFSDRLFGSELNAFISNNPQNTAKKKIPYKEKYTDAVSKIQGLKDTSFISAEDVLKGKEREIVEILNSAKESFTSDNEGIKTIEETINFMRRSLEEKDEVAAKLEQMLIKNSRELFAKYENLYLRLAIHEKLDFEFTRKMREIYLGNVDVSKYTYNYSSFFDHFLISNEQPDDDIKNKFFEIDVSKLKYEINPDIPYDPLEIFNTELGSYIWNLIEYWSYNNDQKTMELVKEKISDIEIDDMKKFAEGALLSIYVNEDEDIEVTMATFTGYCHFNNIAPIEEKTINIFKDITKEAFESGHIMNHATNIPFTIALHEINPNSIKIKHVEKIDFRPMVGIIFNNKEFSYEEDWLKWILDNDANGSILTELADIFSSKNGSSSKCQKFIDNIDQYISMGQSKAYLLLFNYKFEEENFDGDIDLFIKLIFGLLDNKRIDTTYSFSEDVETLMNNLERGDREKLLQIQYVRENLTPYDMEKLHDNL